MSAFTYSEMGATARPEDLPTGYQHVWRHESVGRGRASFDVLARRLMSWDIHRSAGLHVDAGGEWPSPGVDVTTTMSIGPIRMRAPCRVVWTVDDPRRVGFAYGTLQGHPASGEEAFIASIDSEDEVWFTVIAFSRPRTWYAKLGGPVTSYVQSLVTDQYVAAAQHPPD